MARPRKSQVSAKREHDRRSEFLRGEGWLYIGAGVWISSDEQELIAGLRATDSDVIDGAAAVAALRVLLAFVGEMASQEPTLRGLIALFQANAELPAPPDPP